MNGCYGRISLGKLHSQDTVIVSFLNSHLGNPGSPPPVAEKVNALLAASIMQTILSFLFLLGKPFILLGKRVRMLSQHS